MGSLQYQCALSYLDDCLVHSETSSQHLNVDLPNVIANFRKAGFHFKSTKCQFARPSVACHVISAAGIAPDPKKIASIKQATVTDRKELRSFQGLMSYYRKYVKGFARLSKPITDFLKTKKKFEDHGEEVTTAISELKKILTSKPILCHPNFEEKFEVHCDAGPKGLEATQCQTIGGVKRVVMFASSTT